MSKIAVENERARKKRMAKNTPLRREGWRVGDKVHIKTSDMTHEKTGEIIAVSVNGIYYRTYQGGPHHYARLDEEGTVIRAL